VVAYNFPPDAEVGAKRIARLCRYFPQFDINPVVVTIEERFNRTNDESFPVPPGVRVVRTAPMVHPVDRYIAWRNRNKEETHPISTDTAPVPTAKHIANLRRKEAGIRKAILSVFEFPDHYWGWYYPAIRTISRLVKEEKFSLIFSTAPPWTSHLIARQIKLRHKLPWIADFRDSWTSDVWFRAPAWHRFLARKLEQECVRDADLLLCVTDGIRRQFIEHHPELDQAKLITLTNGFDGGAKAPERLEKHTPIVCLHLGELYRGRRIDTLCQAVLQLIRAGKLNYADIRIVCVGPVDPAILDSARQSGSELLQNEVLQFRPRVSYEEGQRILAAADILLVLQGNHRGVSAKFFEYLQSGKPIFAIARHGDLTQLIDDTHSGLWADSENVPEIAAKLEAMTRFPSRSPEEVKLLEDRFHYRSLAERLAKLMEGVARNSIPAID